MSHASPAAPHDEPGPHAAEQRFRALLEHSHGATMLVGSGGRVLFVTESVERVLGYTPAEFQGLDAVARTHPDDLAAVQAQVRDGLAKPGSTITTLSRFRHKDGSWRWITSQATSYLDDPAVGGIVVNFRDVTADVDLERTQRELERRYRLLVERSYHIILLVDEAGGVVYVSTSAERLLGYSTPEFAERYATLIHPDDAVEQVNAMQHVRAQPDASAATRLRLRHVDGSYHVFDTTITNLTHDSDVHAYAVTLRDITERVQIEDALRLSEERLRLAIRSTNITLYSQDRDLRYTWVYNPAAGYDADAMLGKTDHDIAAPTDADALTAIKRRALESGQSQRAEIAVRAATSAHVFDLIVEPLTDSSGEIIGVIGAAIDISDRHKGDLERERLLAEAQDARREMQQALTIRDEFLATISHDLRSPLTSVRGYAQLARRTLSKSDAPADSALLNALQQIESASGSMKRMLDDLLDVATLQSGGDLPLRPAFVDLAALVRVAVQVQASTTDRHQIVIERLDDAEGTLDADRLERAFANVLSNAVKYSPTGGCIAVRLERVCDQATLTVRDSGVGIPLADQARLFRRFQRGSNTENISGTGIGLYSVQQIVNQHGGSVRVDSTEGVGTTVTITLPLVKPAT